MSMMDRPQTLFRPDRVVRVLLAGRRTARRSTAGHADADHPRIPVG
jgi:hypothetical protein